MEGKLDWRGMEKSGQVISDGKEIGMGGKTG